MSTISRRPSEQENAFAVACNLARERAELTERDGHLHPDVVEALVNAGLFKRWVPEVYGGAGASVAETLEDITAISRADGAAGWCVMIANTTALAAYYLSPEWAERIYSPTEACTGGYGMPAGTAIVVDGGLKVSGRWSWGSGSDHCTFLGGGVRIVDETGQAATDVSGSATGLAFFDMNDVELLDTWHVSGLKGTASTDYEVSDAFVPAGRWCDFVGGDVALPHPLTRFSFFGALAAGTAAVAIGLGLRSIDELVDLGPKRPAGSSRTLAERPVVQAELAQARANVAMAESYLHAVADRGWRLALEGDGIDDEIRVELRLAATMAARRAVEAVDLCYHAAGGTAIYETSALQRVFRDAHVVKQHGMIASRTLEPIGRFGFGLPTRLNTL